MRIVACTLRDFRCYDEARVVLGEGLTVVSGPNGAGKTNLLEALYFGCTARSCRTANERELVRFGVSATRVEIDARGGDGDHHLTVGLAPGDAKRITVDGAVVERLLDVSGRPLAAVFLPDRLELVKGPPAVRRAHLDQVVAALWPARAETRRAYGRALAQRNALLARVRAGTASRVALSAWDRELAGHGVALAADRAAAVTALAGPFGAAAAELGLDGEPALAYRPRSQARSAEELAAELAERLDSDVERGFTGHGPHRDDLLLSRQGRDLRVYGSQGQQRLALLSLLLAEREAIGAVRGATPLILLDDVMSELDRARRERLVARLEGGQALVTTTDLQHVPGAGDPDVTRAAAADGVASPEAAPASAVMAA